MTFFEFNPIPESGRADNPNLIDSLKLVAAAATIPSLPEAIETAYGNLEPILQASTECDEDVFASIANPAEFFTHFRVAIALTSYACLALPLSAEDREDFLDCIELMLISLFTHGYMARRETRKDSDEISNPA